MSKDFEVKTSDFLRKCDSRDVLSFGADYLLNISKFKNIVHCSFLDSGISAVCNYFSKRNYLKNNDAWFNEGKKCEILQADAKGWQKGKIKVNVTLEFIPDEPEEKSPLDDEVTNYADSNSLDDIRDRMQTS